MNAAAEQLAGLPLRVTPATSDYRQTEFVTFSYDVPLEAPIFDVHFPGRPVLPGAIIIGLALRAVHAAYPGQRAELVAARLVSPVPPGTRLTFVLPANPLNDRASMSVTTSNETAASLRVALSPGRQDNP